MSEVRNWYCETEGLTSQEVQDYLDYAVSKGADSVEAPRNTKSAFCYTDPNYNAESFIYFGVSNGCTYFEDKNESFEGDAVELKPFQIKHYIDTGEILGEPKDLREEVKEVTDELCETLEQPPSNHELLFYITEALLRPDEVSYQSRRYLAKLLYERGIGSSTKDVIDSILSQASNGSYNLTT